VEYSKTNKSLAMEQQQLSPEREKEIRENTEKYILGKMSRAQRREYKRSRQGDRLKYKGHQ